MSRIVATKIPWTVTKVIGDDASRNMIKWLLIISTTAGYFAFASVSVIQITKELFAYQHAFPSSMVKSLMVPTLNAGKCGIIPPGYLSTSIDPTFYSGAR
jgi:hypothetical protein